MIRFLEPDYTCERDERGLNTEIQCHVLSDHEMDKLGFYKSYDRWVFHKYMDDMKEILFSLSMKEDGSDLKIDVLDDAFGQPYDYQRMLRIDPEFIYALKVFNEVEALMEFFAANGILTGHVYGEYIQEKKVEINKTFNKLPKVIEADFIAPGVYRIRCDLCDIEFSIDNRPNFEESYGIFITDEDFAIPKGSIINSIRTVDTKCAVKDLDFNRVSNGWNRRDGNAYLNCNLHDATDDIEYMLDCWDKEELNQRLKRIMFININTDRGVSQICIYNDHNGFYGHNIKFKVYKTICEMEDMI